MVDEETKVVTVILDQCFRMVTCGQTQKSVHCPAEVEWIGRFRCENGYWHGVGSCMSHVGATDRPVRIDRS
jgi:hypothetical protein